MSYLRNVLSQKCPIYKMSYFVLSIFEISFYENVLILKCPVYEMSYLWNVISLKKGYPKRMKQMLETNFQQVSGTVIIIDSFWVACIS